MVVVVMLVMVAVGVVPGGAGHGGTAGVDHR